MPRKYRAKKRAQELDLEEPQHSAATKIKPKRRQNKQPEGCGGDRLKIQGEKM